MVDGEPVRVSEEGYFLVGFDRDHAATSLVKAVYAGWKHRIPDVAG